MIPNNPIKLQEISDLNKIGIQTPESANLNSSQYVSMLNAIDKIQQIIIFNYQTQTIAHKSQTYKVSAVSIHPQKDILAVIANNLDAPTTIQLINFNSKIKLKQMQLNESVVYMKWVNCNILAFVTLTKVYHFRLDLNNFDNECEFFMELNKDLTNPTTQIIGYCADHSETWFALQVITLCEQKINLKGHIQLYNVELNKHQILDGHCCCFGQYDVHHDIYYYYYYLMYQIICQMEGHNPKIISTICLDTNCQVKRISCLQCQSQYHQNHSDQLVDVNQFLQQIKTEGKKSDVQSPEINQALNNLIKVKDNLNSLQQLINKEIERLQSQSLSNICRDIENQYNILENQIQGLGNDQLEQLAQDMLKYFGAQGNNIFMKDCFLTKLDQSFKVCMNECLNIMGKIILEFQLILQQISQQENKEFKPQDIQIDPEKLKFESLTEKQLLICHTDAVYGIDICKQRNLLASGSLDNTVKLWSLETNALIKSYYHTGEVQDVVFSKSGNLLAFGGSGHDYFISLIDIKYLEKEDIVYELKGHQKTIYRMAFSNNSQFLISGSSDQTLRIWDVNLKKKEAFMLDSKSEVFGVTISEDDTFLASNSNDGKIRIWNFQNRKLLCSQSTDEGGCGIQFSSDQKMIVSSHDKGSIRLWSLGTIQQGKLTLISQFQVATRWIWTVLFSSCSKFIITICNLDNEIKIIDSQTGQVIKSFKSIQTSMNSIVNVKISKDMDLIAYGEDNNIVCWRKK